QDGEAAALVLRDEALEGVLEIGDAGRLDLLQKAEHLEDARLAARLRHSLHDVIARGDDAHAIEVREAHVRERRADALRVAELRRVRAALAVRAEGHRRRRIDDEVDREILFLFVQAEQKLVEALVDVPIEITEVVSGLILAMVGELDAAP